MERNEVMALIANTFKAGNGCVVVSRKCANSAMRKGTSKNRNPFLDRVEIEKTISGLVMGTNYGNSIENAAERMGNSDAVANLKKVWHKPTAYLGQWFRTDKRTETKVYLKLQRNAKQVGFKTTVTYYLDGHIADATEVAAISEWLSKKTHTMSSTQVELGIDEEHEQEYILPQLETILTIKQGDKVVHPQSLMREVATIEVAAMAKANA